MSLIERAGKYDWFNYDPSEGDEIRRPHPFTRMVGQCWSDLDDRNKTRWRAGVWDCQFVPPDHFKPVAHGMGEVLIRVVHCAKLPKPYPRRVFYTRQFTAPDGLEWGKSKLVIHGIGKFRKTCAPFEFDNYVVNPDREPVEVAQ